MLAMPEAILKGLLFEGKDFMQVFLHWLSWSLPSL